MPLAGMGSPRKKCSFAVLTLYRAKRIAPKTGIRKAEKRINHSCQLADISKIGSFFPNNENSSRVNRIAPGATPNETTSARESSCFPISEYAFKSFAAKPSRKSKTAAAQIKMAAKTKCPSMAKIVATEPETRFSEVIKFGIFLIIVFNVLY